MSLRDLFLKACENKTVLTLFEVRSKRVLVLVKTVHMSLKDMFLEAYENKLRFSDPYTIRGLSDVSEKIVFIIYRIVMFNYYCAKGSFYVGKHTINYNIVNFVLYYKRKLIIMSVERQNMVYFV